MVDLSEIERQKSELIAELSGWPDERLHYCSRAGAWSAAQVLDHIVKVEVEILAAARKGVASPHRIGIRDRLGFVFLDRIFLSERQVKVPASAKGIFPCQRPEYGPLVDQWSASRLELNSFYDQLPPDLSLGIFRHPVSGWMTPSQIIRFFSVHMTHHQFQLARIRSACSHT